MISFVAPTAAKVAEFASMPFIRAALQAPRSPSSVLSFFLGVDVKDPLAATDLQEGTFLRNMSTFWFLGHPDYDALCTPFVDVIRQSGKQELSTPEWKSTVDGTLAQVILCDQLSRNCFRGTDEAYAYDETALLLARRLSSCCILSTGEDILDGNFYPAYSTFCITVMMHSEDIKDHENGILIAEWARKESPQELDFWWDIQIQSLQEHKAVLETFERYPHRNAKKGRESTPEELEWLANVDDLPGWAKSQL